MQYLVVVEQGDSGFGAYVPDLPGCVAAAQSRDEVVGLIQEAMRLHIDELRQSGQAVPAPMSAAEIVSVDAA